MKCVLIRNTHGRQVAQTKKACILRYCISCCVYTETNNAKCNFLKILHFHLVELIQQQSPIWFILFSIYRVFGAIDLIQHNVYFFHFSGPSTFWSSVWYVPETNKSHKLLSAQAFAFRSIYSLPYPPSGNARPWSFSEKYTYFYTQQELCENFDGLPLSY